MRLLTTDKLPALPGRYDYNWEAAHWKQLGLLPITVQNDIKIMPTNGEWEFSSATTVGGISMFIANYDGFNITVIDRLVLSGISHAEYLGTHFIYWSTAGGISWRNDSDELQTLPSDQVVLSSAYYNGYYYFGISQGRIVTAAEDSTSLSAPITIMQEALDSQDIRCICVGLNKDKAFTRLLYFGDRGLVAAQYDYNQFLISNIKKQQSALTGAPDSAIDVNGMTVMSFGDNICAEMFMDIDPIKGVEANSSISLSEDSKIDVKVDETIEKLDDGTLHIELENVIKIGEGLAEIEEIKRGFIRDYVGITNNDLYIRLRPTHRDSS